MTCVVQMLLQEESEMQTALKHKKAADFEGCSSLQFGVPLLFGQHGFVREYPEEWVPQCATSAPQCSRFGEAFRLSICKPDSPSAMTHGKQSKVTTNGFCRFQLDSAAAMIHTQVASILISNVHL